MTERRAVYVGASAVGFIERRHGGGWTAQSESSGRCAEFSDDVRAECWVREELYSSPARPNPYEPEQHSEG